MTQKRSKTVQKRSFCVPYGKSSPEILQKIQKKSWKIHFLPKCSFLPIFDPKMVQKCVIFVYFVFRGLFWGVVNYSKRVKIMKNWSKIQFFGWKSLKIPKMTVFRRFRHFLTLKWPKNDRRSPISYFYMMYKNKNFNSTSGSREHENRLFSSFKMSLIRPF